MLAATMFSLLLLVILYLPFLTMLNVFNYFGTRVASNNCFVDSQSWRGSSLLVRLETCLPQLCISRRVVKVLDSSCKVHNTNQPLCKLSKCSVTSLAVPGHNSPTDITIFVDISVNPGPSVRDQSVLQVGGNTETRPNLNTECFAIVLPYSRKELLNIRRTQSHHGSISTQVLLELKSLNILRSRGCRAGRPRAVQAKSYSGTVIDVVDSAAYANIPTLISVNRKKG